MFLQDEGGPIGLDITRVLARISMIVFERAMEEVTEKPDNDDFLTVLHKRYVDNENIGVDLRTSSKTREYDESSNLV